MNRREIFYSQNEGDSFRAEKANSAETYAEDSAFMTRMALKSFREWNMAEQQRLWRIAKRGLEVRRGVYGHISDIERDRDCRINDGAINNGGYQAGVNIEKQLRHLKAIIK